MHMPESSESKDYIEVTNSKGEVVRFPRERVKKLDPVIPSDPNIDLSNRVSIGSGKRRSPLDVLDDDVDLGRHGSRE